MSDKVYIGPGKVGGVEVKGEYAPVSRVTMWYDDEHCYTAGDDTGRTLEMENPWATQAIVDSVYQRLKGFVYRPFEAKEVSLDPAVELGDGVNIGGIYSVIGQLDVKLDKEFAATLACPGEAEIDHEYPYQSAQDRELKRRVKLGQSYFGTRISRKDGLVIERTDGETVTAKAVLNAEELSFYDGAGGRVLFFDPATGTYKFMGVLNVADKFVVDQAGNVTMKGSINLSDGSITWGGKGPVKYQFSASTFGPWHDMMGANDKYRRDSLDGGTSWGDAYQFKGEDGRDGSNGSDASVTRDNMVLAMLKSKPDDGLYTMTGDDGEQYLGINASAIKAGVLVGRDIYGGKFCDYADGGSNPNVWLDMGMVGAGYGLNMWHKSYPRTPVFSIWDNAAGMTRLNLKGDEFLYHDPSSVTKPQGKWDFGDADVKGVTATFA